MPEVHFSPLQISSYLGAVLPSLPEPALGKALDSSYSFVEQKKEGIQSRLSALWKGFSGQLGIDSFESIIDDHLMGSAFSLLATVLPKPGLALLSASSVFSQFSLGTVYLQRGLSGDFMALGALLAMGFGMAVYGGGRVVQGKIKPKIASFEAEYGPKVSVEPGFTRNIRLQLAEDRNHDLTPYPDLRKYALATCDAFDENRLTPLGVLRNLMRVSQRRWLRDLEARNQGLGRIEDTPAFRSRRLTPEDLQGRVNFDPRAFVQPGTITDRLGTYVETHAGPEELLMVFLEEGMLPYARGLSGCGIENRGKIFGRQDFLLIWSTLLGQPQAKKVILIPDPMLVLGVHNSYAGSLATGCTLTTMGGPSGSSSASLTSLSYLAKIFMNEGRRPVEISFVDREIVLHKETKPSRLCLGKHDLFHVGRTQVPNQDTLPFMERMYGLLDQSYLPEVVRNHAITLLFDSHGPQGANLNRITLEEHLSSFFASLGFQPWLRDLNVEMALKSIPVNERGTAYLKLLAFLNKPEVMDRALGSSVPEVLKRRYRFESQQLYADVLQNAGSYFS